MNSEHPIIISFASPKGGVGKSTSCLSIAGGLAAKGQTVHIVDFDQTETIWRWYQTTSQAQHLSGLTVEKGPSEDVGGFIKKLWDERRGYVLVDLAGALTTHTLTLAALAHLVITPAKLSEPDVLEANKLCNQLMQLGQRLNKPITHRILLNEVPSLLAGYQAHCLSQIDASSLKRLPTLLHQRAAYPETLFTGTPPHFADQKRPAIAKAVEEIDHILTDIHEALGLHEYKEAA